MILKKSILSSNISNLRKSYNVKQKDVAKAIGVSIAAYSAYELGKRYPSVEKLFSIAEYFCVSIDYLTGRTPDKQENFYLKIAKTNGESDIYLNDLLK